MWDTNRRKTCTDCRANVTTPGSTWLCVNRSRHCTRCYEPLDVNLCLMVHDVYHAVDEAETARARASRVHAGYSGVRTRAEVEASTPKLAMWLAKRQLKKGRR